MRRFGFAATLMVILVAASAWADVPDCENSYVTPESTFINASPQDIGGTDAERYQDVVVTVLKAVSGDPYDEYDAANFTFNVMPHADYPNLGGGVGGNCPDCEQWYTVQCMAGSTDVDGEMPVRISVGPLCAPSMCCPVQVEIEFPECTMSMMIGVLQNSHDMVTAGISGGIVDLSDIAAFAAAITNYSVNGLVQPCADWVFSPGAAQWGELTLSDIAAFSTHINESCTPFTNPCTP